MDWKVGGEAVWEFSVADELDIAAQLIQNWQGCAEKVFSIEEQGKH